MDRTPIAIAIDDACGVDDVSEVRPLDPDEIAESIIGHIDTMYPKMWEGVPKTARMSLRNTVLNLLKPHCVSRK